jgi:hypothetical protein
LAGNLNSGRSYLITAVLEVKITKIDAIWNHLSQHLHLQSSSEGPFLIPYKVEKNLKGSLDSILSPSPSVKLQTMGGKVCLRYKGKRFLGIVNKLLKSKSVLTSPSKVLPYYHQKPFPSII